MRTQKPSRPRILKTRSPNSALSRKSCLARFGSRGALPAPGADSGPKDFPGGRRALITFQTQSPKPSPRTSPQNPTLNPEPPNKLNSTRAPSRIGGRSGRGGRPGRGKDISDNVVRHLPIRAFRALGVLGWHEVDLVSFRAIRVRVWLEDPNSEYQEPNLLTSEYSAQYLWSLPGSSLWEQLVQDDCIPDSEVLRPATRDWDPNSLKNLFPIPAQPRKAGAQARLRDRVEQHHGQFDDGRSGCPQEEAVPGAHRLRDLALQNPKIWDTQVVLGTLAVRMVVPSYPS